MQRSTLGDEHPDTLTSMNNLAPLLLGRGKLSEAEPLFMEAMRMQRSTLGDDHPGTLTRMSNLASLLQEQGNVMMQSHYTLRRCACSAALVGMSIQTHCGL